MYTLTCMFSHLIFIETQSNWIYCYYHHNFTNAETEPQKVNGFFFKLIGLRSRKDRTKS